MEKISYQGSSFRFLWAILESLFIDFFNKINPEKWEAAKAYLSANAWERMETSEDEISMRRKERIEAEKTFQPTPEMRYVADLLSIPATILHRQGKIEINVELQDDKFTISVNCDTKEMCQPKSEYVAVGKDGVIITYTRKK